MTNKEYLLKYLDEHEDKLTDMISGYGCNFCGKIGLKEYCRTVDGFTCEETATEWLKHEHQEPINKGR